VSETKDPSQQPPDGAVTAPPQSRWKKILVWVGGVLTTAIVIPVVAWAAGWPAHWFTNKISPEKYLSAAIDVPSPVNSCEGGGEGWVFNKDPQQLPGVFPSDDKNAWAAANGGIPASGNYVNVTLQGLNGHTVVVGSISVDVVSRTGPPQGTWANTGAQCGGLKPYRFQANLDTTPVAVTAIPDQGVVAEGQERRPVDLPHSVSGSDPEVWHLTAVTTECTCEWTATLNWSSEGKQGHADITNKGHPFRVAAVTHSIPVVTDYKGGWVIGPK
jgi:hypothetical protein